MVVHTSDEEHTDEQKDELTSSSFLLHQFGAVCGERLSCNSLRQVIVSLPTKFFETHGHFHFVTSFEPSCGG